MSIIKGDEVWLYRAPIQKSMCFFTCKRGNEHKLSEGGSLAGSGCCSTENNGHCPACDEEFHRSESHPIVLCGGSNIRNHAKNMYSTNHWGQIACSPHCNYWDKYKFKTDPWAQKPAQKAEAGWQEEQQPDCNHMKDFEERSVIIKERFAEAIAIFAKHGHLLAPYVIGADEKDGNKQVAGTPIIFNPLATERVIIKCVICDNELRIEQRRHLPPGMEPFSGVTTGLRCEDFRKRK